MSYKQITDWMVELAGPIDTGRLDDIFIAAQRMNTPGMCHVLEWVSVRSSESAMSENLLNNLYIMRLYWFYRQVLDARKEQLGRLPNGERWLRNRFAAGAFQQEITRLESAGYETIADLTNEIGTALEVFLGAGSERFAREWFGHMVRITNGFKRVPMKEEVLRYASFALTSLNAMIAVDAKEEEIRDKLLKSSEYQKLVKGYKATIDLIWNSPLTSKANAATMLTAVNKFLISIKRPPTEKDLTGRAIKWHAESIRKELADVVEREQRIIRIQLTGQAFDRVYSREFRARRSEDLATLRLAWPNLK